MREVHRVADLLQHAQVLVERGAIGRVLPAVAPGLDQGPAAHEVERGGRIGAGFVRGLETTLTFDEEQFVGSGLFLFASVLERFLGLYSSINSFNQLVIRTEQREEIVRRFAPRAGEQELS